MRSKCGNEVKILRRPAMYREIPRASLTGFPDHRPEPTFPKLCLTHVRECWLLAGMVVGDFIERLKGYELSHLQLTMPWTGAGKDLQCQSSAFPSVVIVPLRTTGVKLARQPCSFHLTGHVLAVIPPTTLGHAADPLGWRLLLRCQHRIFMTAHSVVACIQWEWL
jgi:hypothetical protein